MAFQVGEHVFAPQLRQGVQMRADVRSPALRMAQLQLLAQALGVGNPARELQGVARPLLGRDLRTVQREVQRVVALSQRLAHEAQPWQPSVLGAAAARRMPADEPGGNIGLQAIQLQRAVLVEQQRAVQFAQHLLALRGAFGRAEARQQVCGPAPRDLFAVTPIRPAAGALAHGYSNRSKRSPIRPRGRSSSTSTMSRYIEASAAGG